MKTDSHKRNKISTELKRAHHTGNHNDAYLLTYKHLTRLCIETNSWSISKVLLELVRPGNRSDEKQWPGPQNRVATGKAIRVRLKLACWVYFFEYVYGRNAERRNSHYLTMFGPLMAINCSFCTWNNFWHVQLIVELCEINEIVSMQGSAWLCRHKDREPEVLFEN